MDLNGENQYLSTKETRKILGVTTQTLINWDKSGKIRTSISPCGFRIYNKQDVLSIISGDKTPREKPKKYIYCRVSSRNQMDDLQRQIDSIQSEYPNHTLVKDIGSGINWKRRGLQTLLEQAMSGHVQEIVVAHRDRLSRLGFDLIKFILDYNKVKLIVLDKDDEQDEFHELSDDLLSIVTIFACRRNGKRRYKSSKDKNLSDSSTETNIEPVDGNM